MASPLTSWKGRIWINDSRRSPSSRRTASYSPTSITPSLRSLAAADAHSTGVLHHATISGS